MRPSDKSRFYYQLAQMTRAGMPLPRALQRMDESRTGSASKLAGSLQALLADDSAPASASAVSPLERALLAAAKRSGLLAETFELLAEYFATLQEATNRVWKASVYPLVVAHLAIVLLSLPTAFAPDRGIPAFVSQAVWGLGILYLSLAAVLALGSGLWKLSCSSHPGERIVCLLPGFGALRKNWSAAQFASTLSLYFQSSAGVLAALRPAADAAQSPSARAAAEQVVESVRSGCSLGEAMRNAGKFPLELVEAIFTGEETGRLGAELDRCARHLRARLAETIESFSTWLPRLLYLGVIIFTAYRIVSLMAGYYSAVGELLNP